MRRLGIIAILSVCSTASGCATAILGGLGAATQFTQVLADVETSTDNWPVARDSAGGSSYEAVDSEAFVVTDARRSDAGEAAIATDNPPATRRDPGTRQASEPGRPSPQKQKPNVPPPAVPANDLLAAAYVQYVEDSEMPEHAPEEVTAPNPLPRSQFKPGGDESGPDRELRPVTDVSLDIRPPAGDMPTPPAGLAELPPGIEAHENGPLPAVVCSYTPWTICYRPLYFEEIELERYGCSRGIVQPGISAVHFFGSAILMPYKMTVWRPRSCICSNGFSRCEDCRPPGYRECVWSWKAAAVEAGVVAGIAVALPW